MINVLINSVKLKILEDRLLFSGINFTVEKNKLYVVLGKNGSGKSTLLKVIPGLVDKRFYSVDGSVIFNDKDILLMNDNEMLEVRRDKIKYVLQDSVNSFDHLKKFKYYFNNINKNDSEIEELLKYFLLPPAKELFKLYPYEVSGGMAQRISFVFCLLSHPEIILLDEPTSGVDNAMANLFLLKLKEFVMQPGHSALLVTHDLRLAEKSADYIALLSNGRLSEFVPVKEFFSEENNPQIKAFLDSYTELSA